jgi:release factor glutamine methyltransferase
MSWSLFVTFADMGIQEAQQVLVNQLSSVYEGREGRNIADWVMEHLTGLRKIDRLMYKEQALTAEQEGLLARYTTELLAHRPVQYVLGEAWFAGMKFYVNENVLIPRPETEELVEWIVGEVGKAGIFGNRQSAIGNHRYAVEGPVILDIGTGSGCIPIGLKKGLAGAKVYGVDVSSGALAVAQQNAQALGTDIQFILLDILKQENWAILPVVDILVSNPPYIPVRDKGSMGNNVLLHEPHLALFVDNDDALLFYRTLAVLAQTHLRPGGQLYVEIHEDLGADTLALFEHYGFKKLELKKDLQGKDRMIKGEKGI